MKCFGCGFNFKFMQQANQVKLLNEKCNKCASKIIEVEYPKDITPFPDRMCKYTGCLVCDPVLRSNIINPADKQKKLPGGFGDDLKEETKGENKQAK